MRTPAGRTVLLADTVGFIRELPPQLIAAFRTTLEETTHADMLLVVLDVNDPDIVSTYGVILETLAGIGASGLPRMIVLNKIDRAGPERVERVKALFRGEDTPLCATSALNGEGMERLKTFLDGFPPAVRVEERR